MNQHVSKDGACPNSPLECEFSGQFIGNRNELMIHVQNELILLMKQQSDTKSFLLSTRACLARKEFELENLKSFVTEKIGMPVSPPEICVFKWNIPNLSNWRMKSDVDQYCIIRSNSFYTGPCAQGYHLYLLVFLAGYAYSHSKGSHVSVDTCVCKGDYDDKFPKKQHCKFSFTLID